MGAGASAQLADQVSKDEARAFAGERWNEQMDIKFDTMATKGCVAKAVMQTSYLSMLRRFQAWPCRSSDRSLASSVA